MIERVQISETEKDKKGKVLLYDEQRRFNKYVILVLEVENKENMTQPRFEDTM